MTLNCIAVDDEPIALDLIAAYITQMPYLNLLRKCSSALDALKAIHELPDVKVIFLDIRMAELSGLELARIISGSHDERNIRIIFTTAYSEYAIEGYKVNAVDYLLKPFSFLDFSRAASRALDYFEGSRTKISVPAQSEIKTSEKKYIYLKVEYQLVKVDLDRIMYIEGLKDYVKVYLKDEPRPLLSLTSLKSLEEKLPKESFIRFHRSYIVSLQHIKAVTKSSVLVGDVVIPITEQNRDIFNDFLKRWT